MFTSSRFEDEDDGLGELAGHCAICGAVLEFVLCDCGADFWLTEEERWDEQD